MVLLFCPQTNWPIRVIEYEYSNRISLLLFGGQSYYCRLQRYFQQIFGLLVPITYSSIFYEKFHGKYKILALNCDNRSNPRQKGDNHSGKYAREILAKTLFKGILFFPGFHNIALLFWALSASSRICSKTVCFCDYFCNCHDNFVIA